MDERPAIAMRVRDVDATVAFYAGAGFALVARPPNQDLALLRTLRGALMLVAGPGARDLGRHLGPDREPMDVGVTHAYVCPDVDEMAGRLAARGVAGGHLTEMPWGDRRLSVPGPDGYRVLFVQVGARELAAAEWFDLYRRGPPALADLVAGASPAELDRARSPDEWTVRQIVHHTADGDGFWTTPIKVALATPGRVCDLRFYRNNDEWPAGLAYAARDLGPSLALLAANRAHVAQLLEHVPDPWERHALVRRPDGHEPEPMTVTAMVAMQARHALEHAAEVREILQPR